MDSVDLSVFKTLHDWLDTEHTLWLVTVLETFGSSPRPQGAMLALRSDGVAVGSVSGGCIEDDLSRRAIQGQILKDTCEVIRYGGTRDESMRFGLPCGGVMQLLIEPINRGSAWIKQILLSTQAHKRIKRTLNIHTLHSTLAEVCDADKFTFDEATLTTVHGPRWRLLIIGAGQTSAYLAGIAQALDYDVSICDPREEMRVSWNVPGTTLLNDMPDDAVKAMHVDYCTAIVALTHDPKLDDMALLEALKSPAFYVGALGSQYNNDKRRARLALFDLTQQEIDRLHGPVGLDIGSRTPPEIAVAILAHMISVRNQTLQQADPLMHLSQLDSTIVINPSSRRCVHDFT